MPDSTVRIVRGTVEDLVLTVTRKSDGTGVDLTGLPMEFFLTPREGQGTPEPDISKDEADFTLRDQGTEPGVADLKLSASETDTLARGTVIATAFVTETGDRRRVLYQHIPVE